MPKEKKVKKNDIENDALNSEESAVENDETTKDDLGSPTYEELVDINEELEKSVLRANADLDNALKRTVNEVEKAHKYGVEKLLVELLPVIDNLEHALNNLSENATKEDKEGIELTLKSFESALDKFGISPIYPISEDFDPIQHEAVSVVKDEKHADNKIVEVMQKGWRLHERVIRPARVVVIKN